MIVNGRNRGAETKVQSWTRLCGDLHSGDQRSRRISIRLPLDHIELTAVEMLLAIPSVGRLLLQASYRCASIPCLRSIENSFVTAMSSPLGRSYGIDCERSEPSSIWKRHVMRCQLLRRSSGCSTAQRPARICARLIRSCWPRPTPPEQPRESVKFTVLRY